MIPDMATHERTSPRVGRPAIRVPLERILVGGILSLALALWSASVIADPTAIVTLAMASLYGGMGALLAIRRPRNPIGWLFLGVLLVFGVTTAADGLGGAALHLGRGRLPGGIALILVWAETWAYDAMFGLFYGLTTVFPSGHLPRGRTGRFVRISFLVPLAAMAAAAFGPHLAGNLSAQYTGRSLANPAAVLPVPDGLDGTFELATVVLLVAGIVSMFVRFSRARGIEHEQLKWLVASLSLTGALVVLTVAAVLAVPRVGLAVWVFAVLGFATVPPAVGVAVLRYRLFEIDRIVSRTVGWAAVTVVLGTLFVALILTTQALLASIASSNTIAVAVSTLLVAALAHPVRVRVQRRVDHRFNRSRYDAERTVDGFGVVLRNEVELGQLRAEIGEAVALTVQPASFVVWIRR